MKKIEEIIRRIIKEETEINWLTFPLQKIKTLSKEQISNAINYIDDKIAHEERFSAGGSHITSMEKRLSRFEQQLKLMK